MPRNKGTSRKGKPKKAEREAGMGMALKRAHVARFKPKDNGSSADGQGMKSSGAESLNPEDKEYRKMVSTLEIDSLQDFISRAEMADREFASEREHFVVLDGSGVEYDRLEEYGADGITANTRGGADSLPDVESFKFEELSIPRRPEWDYDTSKEELDRLEKDSFLEWRRNIAIKEESRGKGSVTPFEKNLEVWKQLWRVLERSSMVVQLVDARNPLFYLSGDLRNYCEKELGKPMLILINKSDYLTPAQRRKWHEHFNGLGIEHVFFSAHEEQKILDDEAKRAIDEEARQMREGTDEAFGRDSSDEDEEDGEGEEDDSNKEEEESAADYGPHLPSATASSSPETLDTLRGVEVLFTRADLLDYLNAFAARNNCPPDPRFQNKVQFGLVGFPNVGKSSVINVLVGSSKHSHGFVRAAVAAQPGKTKHFQTLFIPDRDDMMLCDCPGLVFPSFVSSTADMIAAGVYPIAQMRNFWPVVGLICQRVPRAILNIFYGIKLPIAKPIGWILGEDKKKDDEWAKAPLPPTAEELLTTYCIARCLLAPRSGVPDHQIASRRVVADYVEGKLLYCHPPPFTAGEELKSFTRETVTRGLERNVKLNVMLKEAEREQVRQMAVVAKKKANAAMMLDPLLMGQGEGEEGDSDFDSTVGDSVDEDDESDEGEEVNVKKSAANPAPATSTVDYEAALAAQDEADLLDGIDILDFVGGGGLQEEDVATGGKRGKSHKKIQKWGKKNRKNLDKDPYGCHNDGTDKILAADGVKKLGTVHTSSGKHGRGDYTRASHFGARAMSVSGVKTV